VTRNLLEVSPRSRQGGRATPIHPITG